MTDTVNPAGSPRVLIPDDAPVTRPAEDVRERQDPDHTQEDFLRDLDRATQRPDGRQ